MSELSRLLEDADRGRWPGTSNVEAWSILVNWAFQTECLMVDEAEDLAWEQQMRELTKVGLPYEEFVTARMDALKARLSGRKLAQAHLRYKYGLRSNGRSRRQPSLLRRDVRGLYRRWSEAD